MSSVALTGVVAGIPSPSKGVLEIGPLSIHAYGLMIALGVVAAVWLTGRRFEERHVGTRDDMSAIAVLAVIAGVIGSRLYHVITDWSSFDGDYVRMLQIWKGGLGIPGGMAAGVLVGMWASKRRGIPPAVAATCAAPALPLAQAIGRWGNWFNQELFGKATTLPWALEVSDTKTLDAGYPLGTTFHPTFLYESLWNFALCGLLLWIDRRFRPRVGHLFAMYVIGYGIGRFWVEGLRIDPAQDFGGLRLNQWMSLLAIVVAFVYLYVSSQRPPKEYVVAGGRTLDAAGFAPVADEEIDLERDLEPIGGEIDDEVDEDDDSGVEHADADDDDVEPSDDDADSGVVRSDRYLPEDG